MSDTMFIPLDDFGKLALDRYISTVTEYNGEVVKLKSVDSIDQFREQFLENDPQFAEINVKIEKLRSTLETLLGERLAKGEPLLTEAYAAAVKDSGVDPAVLDEKLKVIKASARYLQSQYGEEVLKDAPKVETRAKAGGSGGNSSTGGRRIRGFDVYVDGVLAVIKNAEGVEKSTFSAAAKVIGCETTDLQRAFFAAAGLEDVKDDSFPTVVEFVFGEKGSNIRAVKVDDSKDEASAS